MTSNSDSFGPDRAYRRKTSTSDRLLRVAEVAQALGVSVRQVWKLRASSELPSPIKLGGSTRWRESELQAWIRGRRPGGVA